VLPGERLRALSLSYTFPSPPVSLRPALPFYIPNPLPSPEGPPLNQAGVWRSAVSSPYIFAVFPSTLVPSGAVPCSGVFRILA